MNGDDLLIHYLEQRDLLNGSRAEFLRRTPPAVIQALAVEFRRLNNQLTEYQRTRVREGLSERLVLDRFVFEEYLGRGGQAEVIKAFNTKLRRCEAVKIIRHELLDQLTEEERLRFRDRFNRGTLLAAQLNHENIAATYDCDLERCWVSMEHVEGPSLMQMVNLTGGLAVESAVHFVIQAARGLQHAHTQRRPIYHRDVKPSNLLFDERSGKIKIVDFGLARIAEISAAVSLETMAASRDTTMSTHYCDTTTYFRTREDEKLGTPYFMSPEQGEYAHRADHRSDIYSLGCTLYTLLTASPVYDYETPTLVILAHQSDPIPSLRDYRDDVPEELERVFRKMVAKLPERRYQSMREVEQALLPLWQSGRLSKQGIPAFTRETGELSDRIAEQREFAAEAGDKLDSMASRAEALATKLERAAARLQR
jgi:serine/threonine-protein kinase